MEISSHDIFLHRVFQYTGIILIVAIAGGGYWYWQHARAAQIVTDNRPSFEAPLTTSLDLTRGVGVATFSRADGADRRATVTDFEGRIIPVKQNEARFEGARRVENLLSYTQELDNAYYFKLDAATVTANQAVAPDGMTTADLIDISAASGAPRTGRDPIAGSMDINRVWKYSIYLRSVSGSGTWNLRYRNADNTFVDNPVTIDTTWKRYSVTIPTVSSASVSLVVYTGYKTNSTIYQAYAWGAQVEEVTGQANQNPSEYVSTNVKTTFPYHGAGVDGVKYFDYENGNTVASNVVTEAEGSAISEATLEGYLAEGARTNLLTYSAMSATTGWSGSNSSLLTVNNPGSLPAGATNCLRDEINTGQTNGFISKNLALSLGTQYTYSVWAYVPSAVPAGKATMYAWYDNAGWVDIGTSTITERDQWVRKTLTFTSNATYATHIVGVGISGGTPGLQSYACLAQLEQASFASSYIPTTSASVTRARDSLRYPETGNFNDPTGTVFVDVITEWSGGSGFSAMWVADSTNTQKFSLWHWSGSSNHIAVDRSGGGGTRNNADYSGAAITSGTPMKLAQRWTSAANSLFRDGSLRVSDTTLTLPYDALNNNLYIGCEAGNGYEAYSTIKNVRIWKKALTDTELQKMTSTTDGIANSATQKTAIKAPSNTGLVGYWSFEDGSGTKAEDFSPSGTNTGTLTNGPTWVDGKIGKAVNFDGTDDYMRVSSLDDDNFPINGALSLWIKGDFATQNGKTIFDGYDITRNHIFIRAYTSSDIQIVFQLAGGGDYVFVKNIVPTNNAWNHIVVVWDTTNDYGSVYLNGTLTLSGTSAITDDVWTPNEGLVFFGSHPNNGNYFTGQLDEVRLYDYALTASEIAGLYAQGSASKTIVNAGQNSQITDGLVGLWSFNGSDLSGTTAYDRSGQGNNGTLTDGPTVYPGKVGQALSFNGTSASVNLGQPAVLQTLNAPMTISSWVRFPTAPVSGHNYTIIGRGYDWQIEILPTQKVSFRRWSSYSDVQGVSALSATSWYHVVVTVFTSGSDNVLIYVNGQLDKTGTMTTPFNTSASNTRISGYIQADIDYFNGLIDEVRIYNRALSAAEIATLYNMGR